MDYILREGIAQQQAGAHILDVNVGLPEIDETAMMCRAVTELQSVVDLPLQIDTSNAETMEQAMRLYNGKPLINSVNGKQESMRSIFPLVKKYGGVVIALTLDESGDSRNPGGKACCGKKDRRDSGHIRDSKAGHRCGRAGYDHQRRTEAAAVTLEALRLIENTLGVHTSLGVSNISFGLPQRDNVNAAFFTMALQSGLSAAIVNPNSAAMRKAYDAYCALSGVDQQCMDYIARYSEQPSESAPKASGMEMSLGQAIISGLKESAHAAANRNC